MIVCRIFNFWDNIPDWQIWLIKYSPLLFIFLLAELIADKTNHYDGVYYGISIPLLAVYFWMFSFSWIAVGVSLAIIWWPIFNGYLRTA
jgi:hypothetical protein